MNAILLAAGKGTRISRVIQDVPKSTLPIEGKPLIRITVERLLAKGLEPIVCVGYQKEKIQSALDGLPVKYYYNPFYDITNSIATLWFAREEINDEVLILNADVFFVENILDNILNDKRDNVMLMDTSRKETGDYFFKTSSDGYILKYGKELPLEERSCEYLGMAKIGKNFVGKFVKRMDELICSQKHHLWWENILYSFANSNEHNINTLDASGNFWMEIDYFDDYERILNYFNTLKNDVKK